MKRPTKADIDKFVKKTRAQLQEWWDRFITQLSQLKDAVIGKFPGMKKRRKKKAKDTSKQLASYRNLNVKRRGKKDQKARKKAEYLATLPKSRLKRFIYRLHPKRFVKYWFSKEGAIMALKITGIGFAVMLVFTLALFAYFRRDLPDPRDVSTRLLNQTTKFYDRTGETLLFEVYGDQNRTIVEFDEISQWMKFATVAIEDKDFYEHGGFSVRGVTRAAWSNVFGGSEGTQGGSTITQQFIKNSLLSNERTFTRKIKELILAIELERLYSKDEILSFYLNEIPYGSQEYGVEAAAQSFFGIPASELNIAQSALLAALPQAPTYFSPYGENTEDLLNRQQAIIDLMRDQGYIDAELAESEKEWDVLASVTPVEERSLYTNIIAPHFVLEVQRQLEEQFEPAAVNNGGWKVITTLDLELQKVAEKAMKQNIATVVSPASGGGSGDNAAIVATDVETGQIIAMVGSRKFEYPKYGSFNAALANRQPGSSFKPFGYTELFKNPRWGPDSYIYDTNTSFGDYNPKNFDFGYRGRMTVRQALGESRNIPAVKALYIAGVQSTIDLARAMGNVTLGSAEQYGLSLVLGAGEVKLAEHTHAYASFARGGIHKPMSYILSVENADGDVLVEWEDTEGEQVVDPELAWLITDVLTDDAARSGTFGRGNPRLVVPGLTHAVKTGTTDQSIDGWMMGYSRYMSVGVWAGNHDNTPMNSITSWQTGPIFTQFLREAHEVKKYDDKPIFDSQPAGLQRIKIDRDTGYAATDESKNTYTGIFPSWHVKQLPDKGSTYTIDTVSGRLATSCTPERAKEEKSGGGNWPELLPDDPWFGLWSKSAGYGSESGTKPTKEDNVHECDDDLPSVSLDINQLTDGIYQFEATIDEGTHPLDTLNFKVNDQIVSSINANSNGSYSYTHQFTSTGSKKITAEVIDSVLYENSMSQTINITNVYSGSGISVTSPVSGSQVDKDSVTFLWSSDSDADEYRICWQATAPAGSPTCVLTPSTNYPGAGSVNDIDENTFYDVWVQSLLNGLTLQTSSKNNFEAVD